MKNMSSGRVWFILFRSRYPLYVLRSFFLFLSVTSILALLVSSLWAGVVLIHDRFALSISNPLRPAWIALFCAFLYEITNMRLRRGVSGAHATGHHRAGFVMRNQGVYLWAIFALLCAILTRVIFGMQENVMWQGLLLYAISLVSLFVIVPILHSIGGNARDMLPCVFFWALVPASFSLSLYALLAFGGLLVLLMLCLPASPRFVSNSKHLVGISFAFSIIGLLSMIWIGDHSWSLQIFMSRIKLLTGNYFWLWISLVGIVFLMLDTASRRNRAIVLSGCVALPACVFAGLEGRWGAMALVFAIPLLLFAICRCFIMLNARLQQYGFMLFPNVLYVCIYAFCIAWLRHKPFLLIGM
jgi:hypothetical protein